MAYNKLSTANLPEPTISPANDAEPRDYFETFLYTGNGGGLQVGDIIKKPADTTTISNSLVFNDGDSAYLNKTFSSSQTDSQKGTLSFWIKRGVTGTDQMFFSVTDSNVAHYFRFNANDTITFYLDQSAAGSDELNLTTTRTIKDNNWHHLFVKMDMSQASVSDKLKMWIDGVLVSNTPSQTGSAMTAIRIFKNGVSHSIGRYDFNNTQFFDGYMAEFHAVDGTAYDPTDFGNFDANGIWIPKTVTGLTYGTNGFHLDFSDATSTTTLGEDQTANGNDWTLNNFATTDQVDDSPTNNFATLNSPSSSNITYSEGNLKYQHTGSWTTTEAYSTIKIPAAQKFYFEVYQDSVGGAGTYCGVGITSNTTTSTTAYNGVGGWVYLNTGAINHDSTTLSTESSYTTGDTIGVAVDRENGTVKFYKNNTLEYTVSDSDIATGDLYFTVFAYTGTMTTNFGQRSFTYTPPTGFLALSEDNITVDDQNLESPDLVWIKSRGAARHHGLWDSVRGAGKLLQSSSADAETDRPYGVLEFNTNGFTLGPEDPSWHYNELGIDEVAWCWKANGSGVSNTDGSITSTVSANTTSGFSIVGWTGDGVSRTIGHGLDEKPEFIALKNRSDSDKWEVMYDNTNPTNSIVLNETGAGRLSNYFSSVSTTTFGVGPYNRSNGNGDGMIAYCFHSVEGFSKFGSYTGNGSTDGPFVYTGFRPSFVMVKATSGSESWNIVDDKRDNFNDGNNNLLFANLANSEASSSPHYIDFLSNGMKLSGNIGNWNTSGVTYIYMAFAENPFKYSNAR